MSSLVVSLVCEAVGNIPGFHDVEELTSFAYVYQCFALRSIFHFEEQFEFLLPFRVRGFFFGAPWCACRSISVLVSLPTFFRVKTETLGARSSGTSIFVRSAQHDFRACAYFSTSRLIQGLWEI